MYTFATAIHRPLRRSMTTTTTTTVTTIVHLRPDNLRIRITTAEEEEEEAAGVVDEGEEDRPHNPWIISSVDTVNGPP